jgi:hypothetical protein
MDSNHVTPVTGLNQPDPEQVGVGRGANQGGAEHTTLAPKISNRIETRMLLICGISAWVPFLMSRARTIAANHSFE